MDKEVNACSAVEAREAKAMRESLKRSRVGSLDQLDKDQKQQTAMQMQGFLTWLRLDDSDQIFLFESRAKIGEAHPDTVNWILNKDKVSSWLGSTPDTPFLCLQGIAGTGKCVMVARLASSLDESKTSIVARHFCSYTHDSSTQYDQILKSLLAQFAQHSADLVAHIHEEYVGKKQTTGQALERIVELAVDLLSGPGQHGIRILLDGLDECPLDKQRSLLRLLPRLADTGSNCKALVSTRETSRFSARLQNSVLSLAGEKDSLNEAITTYARRRLSHPTMRDKLGQLHISENETRTIAFQIRQRADGTTASLLSPVFPSRVFLTLIHCVTGMFLWATLVLNYLAANLFTSRHEFLEAVETLPQELEALYVQSSNPCPYLINCQLSRGLTTDWEQLGLQLRETALAESIQLGRSLCPAPENALRLDCFRQTPTSKS